MYSAAETYPFLTKIEKNKEVIVPRVLNINYFNQLPCYKNKNIIKKKDNNNKNNDNIDDNNNNNNNNKNNNTINNNNTQPTTEEFYYGKCDTGVSDKDFLEFYNQKVIDPNQWHHKNYKFDLFKDFVYYQHCDLRKQINYERKTNNIYLEDAKNYLQNNDNNNIKDKTGVKGVWFEHRLPYVKLEDTVNWDPMHVLKNISERIFEVWKGDRFSEKVINFCKNIQVHPNLKENQLQP